MVAEVDASNDDDDDDDESTVSVVDNADLLLVDEDVVDCCVSGSDDYVADVVTTVVIHDDVAESEYANVDDDVLAEQLLLSGDDDGESGMSASVGRVVHRVCMSEASSGDVGAAADCGCACEAECATHAVACDADHVRCKRAVNAESRRHALHALRLVMVLLLLVTFAGGAVCAVLIVVHRGGGPLQGHHRQRYQFQQAVDPRAAATTQVQSSVRDAWASAGVRIRRAVQQDEQGRAVSLGATAWSSVESRHSVGARRQP